MIAWWEKRRSWHNLTIISIGFASLIAFYIFIYHTDELKPGEDAVEPLVLIIAPFVINICYTFGWIIEGFLAFILRPFLGEKVRLLGPLLLKIGVIFSLLVVLFPSVYWAIVCLRHQLRYFGH